MEHTMRQQSKGNVMSGCTHASVIQRVRASADGCEDCLKTGDTWAHLRLCMTCGHVGCCDSSPNTHATKHFHSSSHPVIKSFEPGEDWGWCYIDNEWVEADWPVDGMTAHTRAADDARLRALRGSR
jgi:uncharacterized UBP type Zn finger protein